MIKIPFFPLAIVVLCAGLHLLLSGQWWALLASFYVLWRLHQLRGDRS